MAYKAKHLKLCNILAKNATQNTWSIIRNHTCFRLFTPGVTTGWSTQTHAQTNIYEIPSRTIYRVPIKLI